MPREVTLNQKKELEELFTALDDECRRYPTIMMGDEEYARELVSEREKHPSPCKIFDESPLFPGSIDESPFTMVSKYYAEAFKRRGDSNSHLEEALRYAKEAVAFSKRMGAVDQHQYSARVCLMEILQLAGKATRDGLTGKTTAIGAEKATTASSGFFATAGAGAGVSAAAGALEFSLGTTSAEDFFAEATEIATAIWSEYKDNPACFASTDHMKRVMKRVERILDENNALSSLKPFT